jgi:hypothetical protein
MTSLTDLYSAIDDLRDAQELAENIQRLTHALEKLPTIDEGIRHMHIHADAAWDDAVFCDESEKRHHQTMAGLYEREMEMLEGVA